MEASLFTRISQMHYFNSIVLLLKDVKTHLDLW